MSLYLLIYLFPFQWSRLSADVSSPLLARPKFEPYIFTSVLLLPLSTSPSSQEGLSSTSHWTFLFRVSLLVVLKLVVLALPPTSLDTFELLPSSELWMRQEALNESSSSSSMGTSSLIHGVLDINATGLRSRCKPSEASDEPMVALVVGLGAEEDESMSFSVIPIFFIFTVLGSSANTDLEISSPWSFLDIARPDPDRGCLEIDFPLGFANFKTLFSRAAWTSFIESFDK
mmetsp:Transcript_26948/g.39921  ORF Transcript_26948/g.39921 Transcript_26948/m.39921 type:complete len:230 (-) Transcript_26948:1554-2243(-)